MSLGRFIFEMLSGAVIFTALGCGFFLASEKTLPRLEKFCRNRVIGLIIALPALLSCVPHAQIVAPGILQNPAVLYFLALAIPVLSYFYIDFYAARAIGGAIIILAYDLIHVAYEESLSGAVIFTVAAWIFGFAGIWMSGKPAALRDWFRAAAKKNMVKYPAMAVSLFCALLFLAALFMGFGRLQ